MRRIAVGTRKIEQRIFTDEWALQLFEYPGDLVRYVDLVPKTPDSNTALIF